MVAALALIKPGVEVRPEMPWVVLGLFLLGMGLIAEAYFRSRPPVSLRVRVVLACLRTAALVILLLIILDPTLTLTSQVEEEPRVAVLVDASRSMGFSDDLGDLAEEGSGRPRIQRAFELLWGPPEGILESLERKARVRVYQFAEGLRPLTEKPDGVPADDAWGGDQTNLGLALERAVEWEENARPDALVLLSDGLSNVGRDPVLLASHLQVPVHTIGIGNPEPPQDVALTRCVANEVAYVDSRVEVRADISATGLGIGELPILLWEGDRLLDSTRVVLGSVGETHQVSLFFTPRQEGVHRYLVEVPPPERDVVVENNQRLLVVSVLKNKMRTYYVEAYPRWDFAFLRRALEEDANVEVTSRVLTRETDAVLPPPSEMDEVDVVILGNLTRHHLRQEESDRLVRFVSDKGGGIVILGGRNGSDFRGTSLEEIFPVGPGTGQGRHWVDTFHPSLTAEGALHMVTRLKSDPEENRRAWKDLPPLTAMNALGLPKPGAQRLLVHPAQTIDGEPIPVVTVARVGTGKCVLISAYTLWRWHFLTEGFTESEDPFGQFWGNVIRWLVSREDLKRVRVATDRHVYRSGEIIRLRAQVYDELLRPVEGGTVVATITGGERSDQERMEREIVLDPVGTGQGHYEGSLSFLGPGTYDVSVVASKGGNRLGEDRGELAVDTYSLEYERTAMAENLLRQVARAGGGRYYTFAEAGRLPEELDLEPRWVRRVRELHVSNPALLFVLFSGLLFSEWILRKRRGLS